MLSLGIVLLAAKSVLLLFLGGLAAVATPLIAFAAAADSRGDDRAAAVVIGILVTLIALAVVVMQLLTLFACWRAWSCCRFWIWVVIGLAAISIFCGNGFTIVAAIPLIIGGVQALERSKPVACATPA